MGPASNTEERLEALIQAGMNVARLNFSHGEHAIHGQTIANVRTVDEKLGTHTALLADLQGPKLRIGELESGQIDLVQGAELVIRTGSEVGTSGVVYTNYMKFARDVKAGEPVLMDDGKLELRVLETDGKGEVRCEVVHGGVLKPRKESTCHLPPSHCPASPKRTRWIWRMPWSKMWIGLACRSCATPKTLSNYASASRPRASTPESLPKLRNPRRWKTSKASLRRPMR